MVNKRLLRRIPAALGSVRTMDPSPCLQIEVVSGEGAGKEVGQCHFRSTVGIARGRQ